MAATELTARVVRKRHQWSPDGLSVTWLYAYGAIWTVTLVPAALVALAGRSLALPVRHVLGLALTAHNNPPPGWAHVLALAAHNIPIAAWPLLLGLMGAHRHRLATHASDTILLGCIIVNVLPVGAALGAYGSPLLTYLPQLPLEWAGLALGASAWLVQRRDGLTVIQGVAMLAWIVCVLVSAATIETFAVPHQ